VAVQIQDALPYMEPEYWYYPVRQSLGATLLMAGRADEAEAVFRETLIETPNNGWALSGLMQAYEAQGDQAAKAEVAKLLDKAWVGSEPPDLARL
jgi:predicted Zn-dependent protease